MSSLLLIIVVLVLFFLVLYLQELGMGLFDSVTVLAFFIFFIWYLFVYSKASAMASVLLCLL